ncbi:protein ANTAGONIST OF LIKE HETEROCHROMATIN PROTEIN 1-like [Aphis craccivora]|uniref:Protein ANTAGONIST OF LIKE HETEROCHROMATIN PROTEIN 1-like n=1 Tax=Aphis craccivora TaxID=307492 RepID=A0A6G0YNX9_APHCR|nr:protein ANTAGONIST OF LIKE HETEROCHROMATIN PROTEIN 1-like [Aphis craccivora]
MGARMIYDCVAREAILEDEANEELLLLSSYFRGENDEMFSARSREGWFNA